MRLNKVQFNDLTQDITSEDDLVRENLTGNLPASIQQFDSSLNLLGWNRTGLGDIALMAEWLQFYPQAKRYIKNVGLNVRVGTTLPSGMTN